MTVTVNHAKTNAISDWTQAQLDEQIALGNFAPGTTLANIVLPSDWNNDHTLTGLGTMAEQNANSVAITGGSVNGTTIGATTASTGRFTSVTTPSVTATTNNLTLSAISTGKINLNTATANQVQITDAAVSAGQYTLLSRDNAGNEQRISANSSSGGVNFGISSAVAGAVKFYTNGFSELQAQVSRTASAVNYVQVTGAATGGSPTITTQGSDTDVRLTFKSKGNAGITFQNSSNNTLFDIPNAFPAVNYFQPNASVTTQATVLKSLGTDTNISMAFQPKGTGAIDLAAGSRGVNISNGGTVTALTRTAAGTGYTSPPTVNITAPTTAGGVQATATCGLGLVGIVITSGGTGYTLGDVLTVVGGTFSIQQTFTVTGVSAGVITLVSANGASYSVLPANPVTLTGGTGTGASFTITWGLAANNTFTITNAGSGYIEQPTITFSGGGGSGAAAYAQVGSVTTIKSLGALSERSLAFQGPNNFDVLQLDGSLSNSTAETIRIQATPFGRANLLSIGGANSQLWLGANGSGYVNFSTRGTSLTTQFRVTDTASAVNYVQVTGAATGGLPAISAQGSDTDVSLRFNAKGLGGHLFYNGGGAAQFRIGSVTSAANFLRANAAIATATPALVSEGTDTNIDLALTPKGTGLVRFGAYVAGALTATGYINIKAADGTTYKVLVST